MFKKQKDGNHLTKEEIQIEKDIESGKYKSIQNFSEEKAKIIDIAKKFKKSTRINIRINERDLEKLRVDAKKAGIPYQTLIKTLIQQYNEGKIRLTN